MRLIKRPALWQQFPREKEEAMEGDKALEPGHGVSVQAIGSLDQASKPQTPLLRLRRLQNRPALLSAEAYPNTSVILSLRNYSLLGG